MTEVKQQTKQEFNWTFGAETLPNNARTQEIMKKRAEDEEMRRQQIEEARLMKEKQERSEKLRLKSQ